MRPRYFFAYGLNDSPNDPVRMTFSQVLLTAIMSVWEYFYVKATSLFALIQLRLWGATVGKNFRVKGCLVLRPFGKIIIGNNVSINSGPLHVGGNTNRSSFRIGRCGTFIMKEGSGMTNSSINCFNEITICEGAFIGGGCELMDTDFHQTDAKGRSENKGVISSGPIVIGKNVFVGGMCIVRRGVTIGEGSVVATGSLVVKSIPPYEIWGGVPAKFIKKIAVLGNDEGEPA